MNGIHYITDSKGRQVGVQIDLRRYGALWEDFCDAMLAHASDGDALIDWETAKRRLHAGDQRPKRAAKSPPQRVTRAKLPRE